MPQNTGAPSPGTAPYAAMWAGMDVELWSLVVSHAGSLAAPVMPFVCRRLRDAVAYWRRLRSRTVATNTSTKPSKPAFAQQYDYVDALIRARLPHLVKWAVDEAGCEMPQGTCRKIAATGDLDLLKWARTDKRAPWDHATCLAAAKGGSLDVLDWAVDNGCPWGYVRFVDVAARGGSAAVLDWCHRKGLRVNPWAYATAIAAGSTTCVDAAIRNGCALTHSMGTAAALMGNIAILKRLRDCGHVWTAAHSAAAASLGDEGNATLRWLIDAGCPCDASATTNLASRGDLGALKWLHGLGCPVDSEACLGAARNGHLGVIRWLDANGCAWQPASCAEAALGGHLDVIQWAKDRGHPWSEGICDHAAVEAHLAILAWAHDGHGCAWSDLSRSAACADAARVGNLAMLRWLLARGCPVGIQVVQHAAEQGRLDILECVDAHGYNWTHDEHVCVCAAQGGHADVLAWLWERGAPLSDAVCVDAANNGHVHVIEWAVAKGCALTPALCSAAAAEGDLATLMWLRSRGCPWTDETCFMGARHLAVLRWARAQGCPWGPRIWARARAADPEVAQWLCAQDDAPPLARLQKKSDNP